MKRSSMVKIIEIEIRDLLEEYNTNLLDEDWENKKADRLLAILEEYGMIPPKAEIKVMNWLYRDLNQWEKEV